MELPHEIINDALRDVWYIVRLIFWSSINIDSRGWHFVKMKAENEF